MYDSGKILTGLLIFALLLTFPVWYHLGRATPPPEPDLNTPVIAGLAKKECIEPAEYMRAYHMELLKTWRERAVRSGEKTYVSRDGREYPMSLEDTCLKCHSNKSRFCDQCHNYLGVQPNCWNCHVVPEEGGR